MFEARRVRRELSLPRQQPYDQGVRRFLVVGLFVLSACSSGWPEGTRDKLLATCRQNPVTQNTCFCAVDYLEQNYSDFEDVDEGAMARAIHECQ
jgi:hypothetical protein